jgi:cytochrome P450
VAYRTMSQRLAKGDPSGMHDINRAVAGEIAERRSAPRPDFLSRFLSSDLGDHPVSDEEALNFVVSALIAGHETTLSAGAGLVFELARDEGVQEQLREDPSLVPAAVSEALRLHPPVQSFFRTLRKDVTIDDHTLKAGDRVMLLFAAANLDPAAFPSPKEFRLDRPKGRHLSFGHGTHRCIGAGLAELELAILATTMLQYHFHLSGPVRYGPPTTLGAFIGFEDVPVVFDRQSVHHHTART